MNQDSTTDALIQQNWRNFCQHHAIGDWHGTWTFYSSEGQIVNSFQCIRSLHVSSDGNEITHQNHYLYDGNDRQTQTFGPYQPATARAIYLENSFSWGSKIIEPNSSFLFETGFRDKDRRASVVVTYQEDGKLHEILTIVEHLGSFVDLSSHFSKIYKNISQIGIIQSITPDLITSPPQATQLKTLEDLSESHVCLHFREGISISCPLQLEYEKESFFVVDWLVNPKRLYRGIRYFNSRKFSTFSLETFSS